MKINKRLKKIAELVEKDSLCLDIGCDHALLDIYLVKEKKINQVVASDIAKGPLEQARKNINKYHLEKKIELRLGDGLTPYTKDIDTIIISGMGGRSIIGIFKYQQSLIKKIKTIILSPNNYQEDVRKFFTKIGFIIEKEMLVKDGKIIYQIMKFKKGKKKYQKKDYFFGPRLLQKKDQLFFEYYQKELASRKILMDLLPRNYRLKRYSIKKEIKMIEKELKELEK